MKLNIFFLLALPIITQTSFGQTVPVTFYLDARNHQYQTVQLWNWPNLHDLTDDDGDRIFEITLGLQPGEFHYHLLRDNGYSWDPENPDYPEGIPSNGSIMHVTDPMISYLLPKNGDMMRENRIRANFAFTSENPPITASIMVTINGNAVNNAGQYYDAETQTLEIVAPDFLLSGNNTVTIHYTTLQGSISRTSQFQYRPIKLMMDTIVYRMDTLLAWGRVFTSPYPSAIFIENNGTVYQATVNENGYFGVPVQIISGPNSIKVAYTQDQLAVPVDEIMVNAEIRHSWWVELEGIVSGNEILINAIQHDPPEQGLQWHWFEDENNPEMMGIEGSDPQLTFPLPQINGVYLFGLQASDNHGEDYTARKMLIINDGEANFLGIHQRAPWMKEMVIYEVEQSFLDQFTFEGLKIILPHIKKAGINTFRITPFVSGGFIAYDHFEIHKPYGSMEALQDLIATAHQYGIKVLFDVPLSHICPFHPFLYPSFLLQDRAEPYLNFVLWEGIPGESDILHSPDNGRQCVYTNLDFPYTQNYFFRLMEYWVEVANVDGFRIDCGQESFLRSPEFMTTLLKRLRNINPNLFILQEGDNRNHPEVNYYDFGDSAYDWYLNTQWNNETLGFPAIFAGNYSPDLLHELLTTGTPDSGLVLRYANCGYFDYLHTLYGWEQERTAFAIVATTYGLPNIFQGEMVGGVRSNGSYDLTDPLNTMPFYTRLIKIRKCFLGNYPIIQRVEISNSQQVYAYTARNDTAIILTIANCTSSPQQVTVNLSDPAFYNTTIQNLYEITALTAIPLQGLNYFSQILQAWESKVFVVNASQDVLFPPLSDIQLISLNGAYEIHENQGSLYFIANVFPENSLDEITWELQGNTDFATLENGILTARGCGENEVIVIARSIKNPEIFTQKTIPITNQLSGQVKNGTFDEELEYWFLWTPDCNTTVENSNNEALLTFEDHNGELCWSQFMTTSNFVIENGRSYTIQFDAAASNNRSVYSCVREDGNNYTPFCNDFEFQLTETWQTFSFRFTMTEPTCTTGQLHFNVGGDNDWFKIDNVSICSEAEVEKTPVTFYVDMQNETVSEEGVHMNGSWSDWSDGPEMIPDGTIYSATLELYTGDTIEYKFINGAISNWAQYELLSGYCASIPDGNRSIIVPEAPTILPVVCFGSCDSCSTGEMEIIEKQLAVFPNPATHFCLLSGLPEKNLDINVFSLNGKQMIHLKSENKNAISLPLHTFPSGAYRIIISDGQKTTCLGIQKK
ncbi:MAG: carbohydrate binding domain-containing protein [Bacteroidales bacterium]|nr:carbohydrate binding domain-containing protein [Bacteroidales bacterium]